VLAPANNPSAISPPSAGFGGERQFINQKPTAMIKKILMNLAAALMIILAGLALGWSFSVGTCNF